MKTPTETERLLEAMEARARRWIAAREVPIPRAKRKHPKRHGENKERAYREAAKADDMAKQRAAYNESRRKHSAAMRLYWTGQAPDIKTAERMVK